MRSPILQTLPPLFFGLLVGCLWKDAAAFPSSDPPAEVEITGKGHCMGFRVWYRSLLLSAPFLLSHGVVCVEQGDSRSLFGV